MSSNRQPALDRHTDIGELSDRARRTLARMLPVLTIILALESANLVVSERPGADAFVFMSIGTLALLLAWSREAIGLPLLPLITVQTILVYGVPIIAGHDAILTYPKEFVSTAGKEVLVFCLSMTFAWLGGMRAMHPSPPISHILHELNRSGIKGLARLGFGMVLGATVAQLLQGFGVLYPLFALLPSGSDSIILALISVAAACGFFLISMIIGGGQATYVEQLSFWTLLVVNSVIASSDFILAAAAAYLITVAIGLFWSSGRMPWKYLLIVMASLSFLNTGKTTMRTRYWENPDQPGTQVTLARLPSIMAEWVDVSYNAILENSSSSTVSNSVKGTAVTTKNQTLLDRIDNLQNLLFVIDAVKVGHISTLDGKTYWIIPPLLVPRILWPNKPRSHEGQVILNVHFGRQDLESTFTTYIAWGFLPEAYGNFGPYLGSIILGAFLGFSFAWIENFTARKQIVSIEGFLSICLLMNLMNSFEMVASVFVASTFQSMAIITAASLPFVQRSANIRAAQDQGAET